MTRLLPVLLLDDDPDEHYLFKADLEDCGFDFEFAAFTRAADALSYLSENVHQPVLVLTDLGLGGEDALEFIASAVGALKGGAVGIYSGVHSPELDQKCKAAGASFYLVKPISAEKLEDVISTISGIAVHAVEDGRRRLVAVSHAV